MAGACLCGRSFSRYKNQACDDERHADKQDGNPPVNEIRFGQGDSPSDNRPTANRAAKSKKKHSPPVINSLDVLSRLGRRRSLLPQGCAIKFGVGAVNSQHLRRWRSINQIAQCSELEFGNCQFLVNSPQAHPIVILRVEIAIQMATVFAQTRFVG